MKKLNDFNEKLAAFVTRGVATMWCAYLFAALAIYGGLAVDWRNAFQVVQWISQTFLQLVLLSIIMVGQQVLTAASDQQAREMHDAVMEELQIARQEREELKKLHHELHAAVKAKAGEAPIAHTAGTPAEG